MSKLSILRDIVKVASASLGPAAGLVSLFNPAAGAILTAVAKTAVSVQESIPDAQPVDKKTAFASKITEALEAELGQAPTPAMIGAACESIDSLIALTNSLNKAAPQPSTQGLQAKGLPPTAQTGKVGG